MPAALNPKPCARWEVDKYLAATGYLPPTVRPFFVALPKVRGAALAGGPPRRGPPQGDLRPPGPLPSMALPRAALVLSYFFLLPSTRSAELLVR